MRKMVRWHLIVVDYYKKMLYNKATLKTQTKEGGFYE